MRPHVSLLQAGDHLVFTGRKMVSPSEKKQVDFPFLVPSHLTTCRSPLHVPPPSIPLVIQYAQTEPFLPSSSSLTSHVL